MGYKIKYLCPQLEPILGKTYGAIVYQEQVMQIFQDLAGYSLGGADMVRRYMSKKKAEKLAHERQAFVYGDPDRKNAKGEPAPIPGCVANGISAEVANQLFDQMTDFARYAFNKSHAAAYAYNSYITAWMKYYYPAEFFASALNWGDQDKLAGLMYGAREAGVTCLAPDINASEKNFSVHDGKILFGLSKVKGVKDHADEIIGERKNGPYRSMKDFLLRVHPNVTVVNNLIDAGAFDAFGGNRLAMKQMAAKLKDVIPKRDKKASFIRSAQAVLPVCESLKTPEEVIKTQTDKGLPAEITDVTTVKKLESRIANAKKSLQDFDEQIKSIVSEDVVEDRKARMEAEKELLGMYITCHPIDFYPSGKDMNISPVAELDETSTAAYGIVTSLTMKKRRSDGADMAFFQLEDRTGSVECAMFAGTFKRYGRFVKEGVALVVRGKLEITTDDETKEEERQFIISAAEEIFQKKTAYVISVKNEEEGRKVTAAAAEKFGMKAGHPLFLYLEDNPGGIPIPSGVSVSGDAKDALQARETNSL